MSGEVIESPTQLKLLAADGELAGKTLRGPWAAQGISLENADLDGVTIERVGLAEANLAGVRLEHATLKSVDLTAASLEGALLHRLRAYDNTRLTRANLNAAEVRRCELGPNLWMEGASFTATKIQGSTFRAVELARATFKNAVLLRTHFADYANAVGSLMRASFVDAVLIEVDLHEVNLYGADFSRALLVRCDLRGATLSGASMVGARLIDCRTEGADLSDSTV